MANHLLIIPGFGMSDNNFSETIAGFTVSRLPAKWSCGKFEDVVDGIAGQIVEYERNLKTTQPNDKLVIYGFSLGADILMEIVRSEKLPVCPDTVLVLADPNINLNTCLVTHLATLSNTFSVFEKAVNDKTEELNLSKEERADWAQYLCWLKENGADADWQPYRQIAGEIIETVDLRFKGFLKTLNRLSGSRNAGKQQVVIAFSGKSSLSEFYTVNPEPKPAWVCYESSVSHFRLSAGDRVGELATSALALAEKNSAAD